MAETVATIEVIVKVFKAIVERRKELKLLEEEASEYIDLAKDVHKLLETTNGSDVTRYTHESLVNLLAAAQEGLSVVEKCAEHSSRGKLGKVLFTRGFLRKLKKATNSLKKARSSTGLQMQSEILKKTYDLEKKIAEHVDKIDRQLLKMECSMTESESDMSEVVLDHEMQQDLLEERLDDEARLLGRLTDVFYRHKSAASVVVALDTSGSMSSKATSNQTRIDLAKENIAGLLCTFGPLDHLAFLSFENSVTQHFEGRFNALAEDCKDDLREELSKLDPCGGTSLYDAIHTSVNLLCNLHEQQSSGTLWLFLLTDGEDTASKKSEQDAMQELEKLKALGPDVVKAIFVGLGLSKGAAQKLRLLADAAGAVGSVEYAENANDLRRVFASLQNDIYTRVEQIRKGSRPILYVAQADKLMARAIVIVESKKCPGKTKIGQIVGYHAFKDGTQKYQVKLQDGREVQTESDYVSFPLRNTPFGDVRVFLDEGGLPVSATILSFNPDDGLFTVKTDTGATKDVRCEHMDLCKPVKDF